MNNFLDCILNKQWEESLNYIQLTWKKVRNDGAKFIEIYNEFLELDEWKIIEFKSPINSKMVLMDIIFETSDKKKWTVRLICETEPYKSSPNGTWGVNPISIKLVS